MDLSKIQSERKLLVIFSIALVFLILIEYFFTFSNERKDTRQMHEAVRLAETWFNSIYRMKKEKKIFSDVHSAVKHNYLIGDEFTEITTTLGSLEAKEISTSPEFAALVIKYLTDLTIDSTKTVGLILSGSFPALCISSLAAVQTMNAKAIIFSSLGASMFGANQPGATWLDIENHLSRNSGLKYKSLLITAGAEADDGGGLSNEGIQMLEAAALNYDAELYHPASIKESIEKKVGIFLENKIDLLINIGGNQASLGMCVHSINIPNGLHEKFESCGDKDRGIIMRLAEKEIPFVHLLNIKSLAIDNNISMNPAALSNASIYLERRTEKIPAVIFIIVLSGLILFIRKNRSS